MEMPWKPIKLCDMILKESHDNKRGARHGGSYLSPQRLRNEAEGSGRGQGHFCLCSEWEAPLGYLGSSLTQEGGGVTLLESRGVIYRD